jgi:hypothetical protein
LWYYDREEPEGCEEGDLHVFGVVVVVAVVMVLRW